MICLLCVIQNNAKTYFSKQIMVSFFFSHWEKIFLTSVWVIVSHMFDQIFKSQLFCILMSPEWCGISSVLMKQFESSTDKLPMYLVYKKKSSLDYSNQSIMLKRCAVEIKEFSVIGINQENSHFFAFRWLVCTQRLVLKLQLWTLLPILVNFSIVRSTSRLRTCLL